MTRWSSSSFLSLPAMVALGPSRCLIEKIRSASVAMTFSLLLAMCSDAQQTAVRCAGGMTIRGTVVSNDGKPIGRASIHLDSQQPSNDFQAKSDADGAFVFTALTKGNYSLSADTKDSHSPLTTIDVSADHCMEDVRLVLKMTGPTPGRAASGPLQQAMQFADQPNFAIAGVTDWTAIGGHGSDSTLRTSEQLARETRDLKNEPPGEVTGSAHGEIVAAGKDEQPSSRDRESGDSTQERERLHKLLKSDPSAGLYRKAAELDETARDPLSAVHEFEQAARLDPSEQNYFEWGSELLLHRAVWQAQEVFRKGTDAYPDSVRMQTAMGTALFAGARYDEAARRLCKASDLNSSDPTPYIFMGKIQIAAPNGLACVGPKLASFAQREPENAIANYLYAMSILKRQETSPDSVAVAQAQSLLTKAISADPTYADAYLQLGMIAASESSFEKAIGLYQKAIDANPKLADAYYRLGMAYDRTAQPAKAKEAFLLHDRITQEQAEATERQRKEVKQFLFKLSGTADDEAQR